MKKCKGLLGKLFGHKLTYKIERVTQRRLNIKVICKRCKKMFGIKK